MNKYTLEFKDPAIEKKFKQQAADSVKLPTFYVCTYTFILYFMVNLILQIIQANNTSNIISRVIAIVLLFIALLVVKKNKVYVDKGLFVMNLIIAFFHYEKDNTYDEYNFYLYGCNTMLLHTILLFSQGFDYAVVSNFFILGVRLSVTGLYTKILYVQIAVAFLTSFGFVFILYQSEKFQRSSFLMTLKENQWEIMMPLILTKPYLVFSFDQETFTYQLKTINKLGFPFEETNVVHSFLKEAKYGKITLQEHLYFKIISSNPLQIQPFVQEMQIVFKKKRIRILISGCQLGQPNFMIVLQSEDKDVQSMQQQFKQQHQMYLNYFIKHIQQTCKLLRIIVERNQINLAIKLLISHKQSLLFEQYKLEKQININPQKTINKLVNYFKSINYKIKLTNYKTDDIFTIKSCFLCFLYEIFKTMDKKQQYHIKSFSSNSQYIISLQGWLEYPKTSMFEFCTKCLIEQIIKIDNSFQFVFLDSPLISYYESNMKIFANPYE